MNDKDFQGILRGLEEARRYMSGEENGCVTHYYHHWLGDEYDKPEDRPRVRVSYSNFDGDEGLPDDELITPERGVPDYTPMPEERPSDYGPLEIDVSDIDE